MSVCEYYVGPSNNHGDRPECGRPATWVVCALSGPLMYLCDEHAQAPDREPGELRPTDAQPVKP